MATSIKPKKIERIVGYCRASTDKQQITCDAQAQKIRAYATLLEVSDLTLEVDEATTSRIALAQRPAGSRVCQMLKRGEADALVIVKLDRAFRNTVECLQMVEEWDKCNIPVHIIDLGGATVNMRTATGKMLLTFLAGVDEWQRAIIGERTATAMRFKRSKSESCGALPYGWKRAIAGVGGKAMIEPDTCEQAILGHIVFSRKTGDSLRKIASALNDAGVPSKTGKLWSAAAIDSVCAREEAA